MGCGARFRIVRVVARGRRHPLYPFMSVGRPGAVVVGGRGCLPWYGDGFAVGRRVVVAAGGVVDVVVVGWRKKQRHTL